MTAGDSVPWRPAEPPFAPLDGYPVQEVIALDGETGVASATIGHWIRLLELELAEFPQRDTPALENIKAQLRATQAALMRSLPLDKRDPTARELN
jgi:hypothetical protein